jgi:putative ABC transport system substrate-binding protein
MRDVVLAIVIALVLFGAWKLIALAFALGGPMKREGISRSARSVIAMTDSFMFVHRKVIVELTARHKVPAISFVREAAMEGGSISYGVDGLDSFSRAAPYIDRILRGAKPGELPVQAPTKFELVINLKTATTLGLDVPPPLIARADEVIE